MQLFKDVYDYYPQTLAQGGPVPSLDRTPDLAAIRDAIPALFRDFVASTGRDPDKYKIYGSVGQRNWSFAKIPWVAICERSVSTSTERGYYIVLLFREDMGGCFLSLNQGVTQFKKVFALPHLVESQIQASAHRCLQLLDIEDDFIGGPIDLNASGDLGKGYERGAIASKYYPAQAEISDADISPDLAYLLELYDRLIRRVGPDLALALPPISENAFQSSANFLARRARELQEPRPGPLPVPPRIGGSGGARFRRDPNVAALAQQHANFSCEVDSEHVTFQSKASKDNFVEAHHLVPMSLQVNFDVSLDVVENVIALCPVCHRLLHHGLTVRKKPIIRELFERRQAGLLERGIGIGLDQLMAAYAANLQEDD